MKRFFLIIISFGDIARSLPCNFEIFKPFNFIFGVFFSFKMISFRCNYLCMIVHIKSHNFDKKSNYWSQESAYMTTKPFGLNA